MPEENKTPVETSPEELKKQLEEATKLKDEYLAGWQRSRADFLNYKKEEVERLKALIEYTLDEMILKILPLLDNIYLAEKQLPEEMKSNQYVQGLLRVKTQFESLLKDQDVTAVETLGKKFDPQFQEAVEEVETKGQEPGLVVEEVQKGYLRGGQLLRPAKVKVSKN